MFKNLLRNTDYILLVATIILVIIGVIGIYSAGYGEVDGSNTEYQKQLIWFGIVLVIEIFLWAIDTRALEFLGYAIYAVSFVLLIVVLAMPSVFGAHSWILIQGFSYQPSELMKIGYILCSAKIMAFGFASFTAFLNCFQKLWLNSGERPKSAATSSLHPSAL